MSLIPLVLKSSCAHPRIQANANPLFLNTPIACCWLFCVFVWRSSRIRSFFTFCLSLFVWSVIADNAGHGFDSVPFRSRFNPPSSCCFTGTKFSEIQIQHFNFILPFYSLVCTFTSHHGSAFLRLSRIYGLRRYRILSTNLSSNEWNKMASSWSMTMWQRNAGYRLDLDLPLILCIMWTCDMTELRAELRPRDLSEIQFLF